MRVWPSGMLKALREWCDRHGAFLIADEVMTGFGRTGTMFACEQERVIPDLVALAKGLTGGYMPLAATLVREKIFEGFLGSVAELRTFYYGHSYTANPLGCAAALANLRVFREENVLERLQPKIELFAALLQEINELEHVAEVRRCGLIAGVELVQDKASKTPYPWERLTGAKVCMAARKRGVLTRPILDVITLMPPLCVTDEQLEATCQAIRKSILEICGNR